MTQSRFIAYRRGQVLFAWSPTISGLIPTAVPWAASGRLRVYLIFARSTFIFLFLRLTDVAHSCAGPFPHDWHKRFSCKLL
ncbi:hypothetical protein B0H19DRAFT_311233 [Mycena capillaripes]|nr:hypothetical protein B0H19DRAFT_311233 [Mycena capillaripes]